MSDPQEDSIPSGGSLSPGPAMPVTAPPSLPGGNMLQSLGASPSLPSPAGGMGAGDPIGGIANAIQSSIGYATQDRALQDQAAQREKVRQQYQYTAAAHAGIMQAMDKLASGDTQGARDVLKGNPAVLFSPEGMQLYGKTAEMDRAIAQHKASVSVLSSRSDVWSQLAGGILQSDPTMSTKDAMTQATDILKLNKVEKADDGFHIISPTGQPIGFIPAAKIMTKKREESIVSVGGVGAGSQPTIVAGEQQPVSYFHTLPAETRGGLLQTKGFDPAHYDMIAKRAADNPDGDNTELNTWNRIGEITAQMRKNPMEWQAAAARIGVTPEEAADPTIMNPLKATSWQTRVTNDRVDQAVETARGVHKFKMQEMGAADAFPSLRGQEIVDPKTFQSRSIADLNGNEFLELKKQGWQVNNPKDVTSAKYANAAISGVNAANDLVSRIFHDLGPDAKDMRFEDAWKAWSSQYTASSNDVAAYRAIKVSLATEIGKALNPQGRGSDQARKELETILPGGFRLETLGTAKATLDVVRGELDNRRRSVLGMPLNPIPLPQQPITWKTYGGKTYGSTNPSDKNSWFEKSTADPYGESK